MSNEIQKDQDSPPPAYANYSEYPVVYPPVNPPPVNPEILLNGEGDDVESQSLLGDSTTSRYRCAQNGDDWCEDVHVIYDSKICWALVFGLLGFVVWPFAIIGYLIIRPVKKSVDLYHRHWCKVSSVYYLNLFVMICGFIETIVGIYFLIRGVNINS